MTAIQPLETLIVEDFGAYVGKHSERLRVTVKGETKAEAPLLYLRQVLLKGRGVSVSSDAILACAERGIALHVVSSASGASLYTDGLTGTVQTRRAQLLAYTDGRAVQVAGAIARAKILNQAGLLSYHARSRKQTDAAAARELHLLADEVRDHEIELDEFLTRVIRPTPTDAPATADSSDTADTHRAPIERYRSALLSIEGRAAQKYWAGVRLLVPQALGWEGRRGRGAHDPINSALNYGYAILARQVEQALVLAGLDPFAGFLHADRPGKPSLTFDLIEEFRQPVVDRVILGMVGKHMPITVREDGMLDDVARRTLATKIIERIEEGTERYEGSKRWALREIIQTQARHLATFLRRDRADYRGFVAK
jgi:CRISPR-associated protein Cas1